MPLPEPGWWYAERPSLVARALSPLATLWGSAAERRFANAGAYRAKLPVICIGNFTAGGTGKTPLSLHVASELLSLGIVPAFLTRGYGGRTAGPHWVAIDRDQAAQVGDEPLLLARVAPTLVSRDRALGARTIEAAGEQPRAIIMDDGLQNGALAKDLTIAVVDGRRGVGNGLVIPAGPLRASLAFQLGLADAVVVNAAAEGGGAPEAESPFVSWLRDHFGGPVLRASTQPSEDMDWLRDLPIVAFSGIGAPERFFRLLERLGARIIERRAFADHHRFTERDARGLLAEAQKRGATLCTTEKDWVRLGSEEGALGILRQVARTVAIRLVFSERDGVRLKSLIEASLVARGVTFS
ncbi:MAG: tetraacyldisaccharide 4'-kinase [Hyphomicrobiaceae bacterium]